ncbi:MAG: IS30 family transposase [Gemmatimonadetes bacterium]|nr:IS30 family transposase [Gemmatimonadota bacterium]
MRRLSESEKVEIWDRFEAGESLRSISRQLGRPPSTIRTHVVSGRFRRPLPAVEWSPRRLSLGEREEISRGLAADESLRCIARRLGRAASTVSREVAGNGGRVRYRAAQAHQTSRHRAQRPKPAKLASNHRLRTVVEDKLERWWSPRQISRWLLEQYPDDEEMRVSHETIYQSLFIQGKGALRKELWRCLRTGRAVRRPQGRPKSTKGQIRDMVMISERPAEVEDRAVPGHWEGDLLMGKRQTAIGTLVERWSRYVMLFALPDGNTAEAVRDALTATVQRLPEHLWQSLTWDQGKEMAQHAQFSVDTGIEVFFCDPNSPWQRGTNENTNGLLRQYFPKGTDMSKLTQDDLDQAAYSLNTRPRQTLNWMTPSDKLAETLQ